MTHDWERLFSIDAKQCRKCGMLITAVELVRAEGLHAPFPHCMPFTALFVGGPDDRRELVLEPPAIDLRDGYAFDQWVSHRYCEYVWMGEP